MFIAHAKEDSTAVPHALEDHLKAVASLAKQYAESFDAADLAYLAGLWHDLGKFAPEFQRYIRQQTGFERENAHVEPEANGVAFRGRYTHSTAGAIYACEKAGSINGRLLAYLISGHHAGLPDAVRTEETPGESLEERLAAGAMLAETLKSPIPPDILTPKLPGTMPIPGGRAGAHLWLRMLFSCLVDADFLDTEAYMSPDRGEQRRGYPSIPELDQRLRGFLDSKFGRESTPVHRIRAEVLAQCRARAGESPGLFSLTVPTGGGKTYSSLAFALAHAVRYKRRRIVYAIPYTSIIEQTADAFRAALGNDAVLEHHSQFDPSRDDARSRLAAENWDAPVIVTTNVQLLESLYAAKPSRCRKLHNIAGSVIVLDEAQMLPPEYLSPVVECLRLLVEQYGCTVVLCTATQPALGSRRDAHGRITFNGLDAREIVADPQRLEHELNRVRIHWPADFSIASNWDEIASRVSKHERVLTIVNTRADCRELWQRLPTDAIHLSALMCGAHRSTVIAYIKTRLAAGDPVQVVSTQLVEAGVDLDFPVVFRALTGLDSIAQAAGRCNREGRLGHLGNIHVFVPPRPPPRGLLLHGYQATKGMLGSTAPDRLGQTEFRRFFERLYSGIDPDREKVLSLLTGNVSALNFQFRTAAMRFKLINDANQAILVPYGDGVRVIDALRRFGPTRERLRAVQRYTVQLSPATFNAIRGAQGVEELKQGFFILKDRFYDAKLGVTPEKESWPPDELIA